MSFSNMPRSATRIRGQYLTALAGLVAVVFSHNRVLAESCPLVDADDGSSDGVITISANTTWTPSDGTGFDCTGDDIHITSSATLTINGDTANGYIGAISTDSFTIDSGSTITADTEGCAMSGSDSGYGPNASNVCVVRDSTNGAGEGVAGTNGAAGGGGGYGGAGADGDGDTVGHSKAGGRFFGLGTAPEFFGASGGSSGANALGGNGGGAIKIVASGDFTHNGLISTNGGTGGTYLSWRAGGGGSGGAIYLSVTGSFNGTTGTFEAKGGAGANNTNADGGGGGGGRIAIVHAGGSYSFDDTDFDVSGGTGPDAAADGDKGSVYVRNSSTSAVTIYHGFVYDSTDHSETTWTMDSSATNQYCSLTRVGQTEAVSPSITATNLTLAGTINCDSTTVTSFDISSSSSVTVTSGLIISMPNLNATMDLGLANDVDFNNVSITIGQMGELTIDETARNIILSNGSTFTANVDFNVQTFELCNGCSIDADFLGCDASTTNENGFGPTNPANVCTQNTTGYGAGKAATAGVGGGGGGYGGAGGTGDGTSWDMAGGTTYGSNTAPTLFGSTGGSVGLEGGIAGSGGGRIKISTLYGLVHNGTMTAVGGVGEIRTSDRVAGGGSGGSIYLTCGNYSGSTGTISVAGGNGSDASSGDSGGGGGGRAAVHYAVDDSTFLSGLTAASVAPGGSATDGAVAGSDGTLYTASDSGLLAARLKRAKASSYDDGIALQWRTIYEADILGFNIYRQHKGKRQKINRELVPGLATQIGQYTRLQAGHRYRFWTPNHMHASLDDIYQLEAIDLSGSTHVLGDFESAAGVGDGPAHLRAFAERPAPLEIETQARIQRSIFNAMPSVESNTLTDATANEIRARATSKRWSDDARHWSGESGACLDEMSRAQKSQWRLAASSNTYKIAIKKYGWHRITASDLPSASENTTVNFRKARLFLDGEEVALRRTPSTIEFYGMGSDSAYSSSRTYWLSFDGKARPPLSVAVVKAAGGPTSNTSYYWAMDKREENRVYLAALQNGDGDNFFDTFLADKSIERVLTVSALQQKAGQEALLDVALHGFSHGGHEIQVKLNGSVLGIIRFAGQILHNATFSVPVSVLREGENYVGLETLNKGNDKAALKSLSLVYPRAFIAEHNSLYFTTIPGQAVSMRGFEKEVVRIVDITEPNRPKLFDIASVSATGRSLTIVSPSTSNSQSATQRWQALADEAILKPAAIYSNAPSRLHSAMNSADQIIVSHDNFIAAAHELASYRRDQGYRVVVASIESVFDEFSFGQYSVDALRCLTRRSMQKWKVKPTSLLLLGDSSFDPQNILGLGAVDFVPTKIRGGVSTLESSTDSWIVEGADGFASMAVGRIPLRSLEDALAAVHKIVRYEGQPTRTSPKLSLITTDEFPTTNSELTALTPASWTTESLIMLGSKVLPADKAKVIQAFEGNMDIVNYFGHGSVEVWGSGDILDSDSVNLPAPTDLPPLVLSITCLSGFFHDIYSNSLAEALVMRTDGGAIASISSSALAPEQSYGNTNQILLAEMLDAKHNNLGEAYRSAINKLTLSERQHIVLLGDPLLHLRGLHAVPEGNGNVEPLDGGPMPDSGPSPDSGPTTHPVKPPTGPPQPPPMSTGCSIGDQAAPNNSPFWLLLVACWQIHRRRRTSP